LSVTLPTSPGIRSARIRLLDFGGPLTPGLGGPVQRIERLGTRSAVDYMLPPMLTEPAGRTWLAILARAKREGAVYPVPQPGLLIGAPGSPVVNGAVAGGTSLPLRSASALYAFRAGQAISIFHGGRRYLYFVETAVAANASGVAVLTLDRLLRTALTDGDAISVAAPLIEGALDYGDAIDLLLEPYSQINFTIMENA